MKGEDNWVYDEDSTEDRSGLNSAKFTSQMKAVFIISEISCFADSPVIFPTDYLPTFHNKNELSKQQQQPKQQPQQPPQQEQEQIESSCDEMSEIMMLKYVKYG